MRMTVSGLCVIRVWCGVWLARRYQVRDIALRQRAPGKRSQQVLPASEPCAEPRSHVLS